MKTSLFIFTAALFFVALPAASAETTASASFDPPVVRAGESAIFRLNFREEGSGSMGFHNAGPPRLPQVDGLRLRYLGPNQQMRIVNGESSVRVTHLYRAEPSGTGRLRDPCLRRPPRRLRNRGARRPAAGARPRRRTRFRHRSPRPAAGLDGDRTAARNPLRRRSRSRPESAFSWTAAKSPVPRSRRNIPRKSATPFPSETSAPCGSSRPLSTECR